ncbi:hypothetical protein PIB30_040562 [Stylosanthes scabra]|uniref:Uncharacterized protein n=1 Tax=Stylosanthes scabra TaxID=79078 RepID=A0ABU6WD20_9FABA|nr:hypothetical protein [Stylosanthes scabra]
MAPASMWAAVAVADEGKRGERKRARERETELCTSQREKESSGNGAPSTTAEFTIVVEGSMAAAVELEGREAMVEPSSLLSSHRAPCRRDGGDDEEEGGPVKLPAAVVTVEALLSPSYSVVADSGPSPPPPTDLHG